MSEPDRPGMGTTDYGYPGAGRRMVGVAAGHHPAAPRRTGPPVKRLLLAAALAATTLIGTAGQADAARTQGGYWMLTDDGSVHSFGGAATFPDDSFKIEGHVKILPTVTGEGYWVLHASGVVDEHGDAKNFGPSPTLPFDEDYASMAATPTGDGYWLFTSKGRVFRFGDAVHHGDMRGTVLNGDVLDAAATPNGGGYFMVGSDGGIFTFGNAKFRGSMGGKPLNKPVMSMATDPDGLGYWLVASDGGIFTFDAAYHGSMGHITLAKPVSGIVPSPTGGGYLMVAEDGGVFTFGDVPFYGSLGANPPAFPVVAIAAIGDPGPAPVLEWRTVATMSSKTRTASAPFRLEKRPVRMSYSCTTPTGEGSGCLTTVKNADTGSSLHFSQPDANESGTTFLHPTAAGNFYIEGDTYDWRGLTTWSVLLEQEVCVANCT